MPLLTELENGFGCDSTKMSPLTGLAVGMIFSGQIFDEAQSQNCETRKTHARPARKTGGDSGEVKMKMKIMKWRVIITIELNKQRKSSLRQQIKKELAKCGINRQRGKNTWEGQAITAADAVQKMSTVLSYLADPKKISNPKRAQFDHLWVYVDRVETEVA